MMKKLLTLVAVGWALSVATAKAHLNNHHHHHIHKYLRQHYANFANLKVNQYLQVAGGTSIGHPNVAVDIDKSYIDSISTKFNTGQILTAEYGVEFGGFRKNKFLNGIAVGIRVSNTKLTFEKTEAFFPLPFTQPHTNLPHLPINPATIVQVGDVLSFMALGNVPVIKWSKYTLGVVVGAGLSNIRIKTNDTSVSLEPDMNNLKMKGHCYSSWPTTKSQTAFSYMLGITQEVRLSKKLAGVLEVAYVDLGTVKYEENNKLKFMDVNSTEELHHINVSTTNTGCADISLGVKYYL